MEQGGESEGEGCGGGLTSGPPRPGRRERTTCGRVRIHTLLRRAAGLRSMTHRIGGEDDRVWGRARSRSTRMRAPFALALWVILALAAADPSLAQGRVGLDRLLDRSGPDAVQDICTAVRRNPASLPGAAYPGPAHERILDAARSACATGVMHIRHYPLGVRGRETGCEGNRLELPRQEFNFLGHAITEISKAVGRPLAIIIDCVAIDELTFGHYEADVTDDLNARIGKLIIRDSVLERVSLSHLAIDDVLQISQSQIASLHLASLRVGGDVVVGSSTFGTTWIVNSRVDNNLVFSGTRFTRTFTLNRVSVGRNLYFGYSLSDYAMTKGMNTGGAEADVSLFSMSEVTAGALISFNDARIAATSEITLNGLRARGLTLRATEFSMPQRRSARPPAVVPAERKPADGQGAVPAAPEPVPNGALPVPPPRRVNIVGARISDEVELTGVRVAVPFVAAGLAAGRVEVQSSTFAAGLSLPSCDVGRLAFLASTEEPDVENSVAGRLDLSDCRFREAVLAHAEFGDVDCSGCRFENYLQLAATFRSFVNLEGATLVGGLRFGAGQRAPRWLPTASLSLAGVKTPRIHLNVEDLSYAAAGRSGATTGAPVRTKLSGAEYQYLAPRVASEAEPSPSLRPARSAFALQDVAWLRRWLLSGMVTFDPQPFANLSRVLVDGGNRDAANDLHVHRVGALLAQSDSLASRIKLVVGWPIGWGYKPDWVIYGLIVLTTLGALVWGWLAWPRHAPTGVRLRGPEWPAAVRAYAAFGSICVAASVFRLFPNFSDIWKIVPPLGTDDSGEPTMPRYFILHTIVGSLLVFLLLTPLVGLFD
jgi:hypothetical protein